MRNLTEIIVHCSATRPDWMAGEPIEDKVAEIRRWHVEGNGWSDIGYHWIIDRDGAVAQGRPMSRDGAHAKGHNAGTVGICVLGGAGSSDNDSAHENYTPRQLAALRMKIADLRDDFPSIKRVSGHNEYSYKACPGFNVPHWLNDVKPRTSPMQSTTLQATVAAGISGAAGVGTALSALDGTAQIVMIVLAFIGLASLAWIARERIKRWGQGDR